MSLFRPLKAVQFSWSAGGPANGMPAFCLPEKHGEALGEQPGYARFGFFIRFTGKLPLFQK